MSSNFFYYINDANKPVGPLSIADLRRMQRSGILSQDVRVCPDGGEDWVLLNSLENTSIATMTPRYFQNILTASIVAGVLSIVASILLEDSLPPPMLDYLATEYDGSSTMRLLVIAVTGVLFLIAFIIAYVGLYMLKRWARFLFLVLNALGVVMTVFLGPYVEVGLESAFASVDMILVGGVLTLAYFSSISSKFS